MKRIFFLAAFLGCTILFSSEEFITVYKSGNDFFVRNKFSETEDLIIHNWRYANEKSYIVKRGTPIQDYKKGFLLHASGDDYPASTIGGYGFLSGNHGSAYTRILHIPNHGLTVKDMGGIVKDSRGTVFIIVQIPGKNHILIHPEGRNNTVSHGFTFHTKLPLFYKGKELPFKSSELRQLYPMNRIINWQLLANGTTPVPEKKEIKCRFLDFIFDHDVLNPYHVVQSIKNAPGKKTVLPEWNANHHMIFVNTDALKKTYANFMKFPALATFYNKFRFEPGCVNVNYRKAVYHVAMPITRSLDIMFMWNGGIAGQKRQIFYIPKLKPITLSERGTGKKITLDLSAAPELPRKLDVSYFICHKDLADRNDMPDRYIRVTGDEKELRYGIALGYSLFMGHTAKGASPGERPQFYHIYRTHKMYPVAYTLAPVRPGRSVETVSYRQYFDPRREPDTTSFYCHHQGKSLVVYLDFHKVLKNKVIKLPKSATGKKITVLEKTPALKLHTTKTVPAEGIKLDNAAAHGRLVLKLD